MSYATRGGDRAGSTYRPGHPTNGYNFGHAVFRKPGVTRPAPPPLPAAVESLYELLGKDDVLLGVFACFLDACDRLRVHLGPGKIVRAVDRALLKVRHPHKGRP